MTLHPGNFRYVSSVPIAVAIAFFLNAATARPPLLAAGSSACESLASMSLPDATVTLSQSVAAGSFTLPEGRGARGAGQQNEALKSLPAFCRVAATLKPSADSDIRIEVWMPASGWNGKYMAVGNGGWNGTISYPAMIAALGRGYATSSTDTGHVGGSAEFALGHAEKVVDFGYRSVHEMTATAKTILKAFYDSPLQHAYWNGCSAGGRQAMKAAQKFPADFDGIIAGSPALDHIGRAAQAVRIAQTVQDPAASVAGPKAQLLHNAILEACDAVDGVKDGVLEDPTRCTFDPGVLQCQGADGPSCLTAPQVATARRIYSAAVNPKTKREIAGLERGSELGWTDMGWSPTARAAGLDHFRFVVFQNPAWDVQQFKFEEDIVRADEADHGVINALDANLKSFLDRGGRLIQYHGWADPQIAPGNSVQYYKRALEANGGLAKVRSSYRLFMAPGMAHCGGGEGPNSFDMVTALEQWVEMGKAPDQILASRIREGRADRTRPLCPYPQVATYKGSGSTDDAANFVCK